MHPPVRRLKVQRVHVHVVGVDMADQDAVVVVIQVVAAQHVQVPPHRRHDVVNPPLQHGAAGQPLVLPAGRRKRRRRRCEVEEEKAHGVNVGRDGKRRRRE